MPDPSLLDRIKEKLKGKKSTTSAGGKCGPKMCKPKMSPKITTSYGGKRRLSTVKKGDGGGMKVPPVKNTNASHINPRQMK